MPAWNDVETGRVTEDFISPGEVVLRAAGETLVTAMGTRLSFHSKEEEVLEKLELVVTFDRSQLHRLNQADPCILIRTSELLAMDPNIPITATFEAKDLLLSDLRARMNQGTKPENCAVLTNEQGFPLCFDMDQYRLVHITTPSAG